jgi:hypothetical protein
MRIAKLILIISVAFAGWAQAATTAVSPAPKSMKYFSDPKSISLKSETLTYLQTVASRHHLEFYSEPKGLLIDALMTDEKLERAILITANHKLNPEDLNKVYSHYYGFFSHVSIYGQQIGIFFINFSDQEAQNAVLGIQKDLKISRIFSSFIPAAQAELNSETARIQSSSQKASAQPERSLGFILGQSFLGCGKGILIGLNDLARSPWDAVVSAAKGTQSLREDPNAFWNRSVQEFQELGEVVAHFWEYLGKKKQSFLAKSPKEKNEILCGWVGAPALVGAAGKAAQAAGYFESKAPVLTKAETKVGKNLLSIFRGTKNEAALANRQVLNELNSTAIANDNPKRLSGLEKVELDELFKRIKDNPVTAICNRDKYDPKNIGIGFCFGRAIAAHIEALRMGLAKGSIKKAWAVGELNSDEGPWRYHVTTVVRGTDGTWWALDTLLNSPVTIEDWYGKMKSFDAAGDMRLFVSEPQRFGPDSAKKYSPKQFSHPGYNNFFNDLMDSFQKEAKEVLQKAQAKPGHP